MGKQEKGVYLQFYQQNIGLMRILLLLLLIINPIAGEQVNSVIALIGGVPITQIDFDRGLKDFKSRKGVKVEKGRDVPSQVLDLLISRTIVKLSAEEESIVVSDKRVDEALASEISKRGLSSEKQFAEAVKKSLGISLAQYKEEMRRQLVTQQVMQLKVNVPPPSQDQIEDWYASNKSKLGNEYLFRLIFMPLRNKSTAEEIRINKAMESAKKLAKTNFAAAAKKYSSHPSKARGGLSSWTRLDELAMFDRVLAGAVQNSRRGQVSQVFVGERGYYIVKVERSRRVTLDSVIPQIQTLLYAQNEQIAFVKWVKKERRRIAVDIRLQGYIEP